MSVIGFDTSNYTTSIAYFDGHNALNISELLPVREGALGLRQSDAVFHHTQSLPVLSGRLFSDIDSSTITAVGVSTQPRAVEGSYMPCFTVGYSHARLLAEALHIPLFTFSHQQGHVAAALWSAKRMDLLNTPHLAWHLSGGTTELLLVEPEGANVRCSRIGGTTDISAGQLIDRTGQLLNLRFPAGKQIDQLSQTAKETELFRAKCENLKFSFSGLENKVRQYHEKHNTPAETAAYALRCIVDTILRATIDAQKLYPDFPIVFSGGVASNQHLRATMQPLNPIFAEPQYSTDNALGVAVLAHCAQEQYYDK